MRIGRGGHRPRPRTPVSGALDDREAKTPGVVDGASLPARAVASRPCAPGAVRDVGAVLQRLLDRQRTGEVVTVADRRGRENLVVVDRGFWSNAAEHWVGRGRARGPVRKIERRGRSPEASTCDTAGAGDRPTDRPT